MFTNTKSGYGLIAITLHWIMALLVLGLFGLGLYMVELTYYDSWYRGSMDLHKSIGISLVALLIFRFLWRALGTQPTPISAGNRLISKIAHAAHLIIYFILVCIVISGYLISTADGRAIEVFEVLSVPAIDMSFDNQADIAGLIHYWAACCLIGLVTLHALGALKHHFIDKDKTLIRMIKVQKDD